jgi:hypothetical protein
MDGVELLEAVKKNKTRNSIVMISGHGIWRQLSIRCGWVFDYISNRLISTTKWSETHWTKRNLFQRTKF